MGIPCCRCIAEVSGRAEDADYGDAIHRGREVALGGESGALPGCHQLLRPCIVPACPSRDADDSQGRSFPPPSLCSFRSYYSTLVLFISLSLTLSLSLLHTHTHTHTLSLSFSVTLTFFFFFFFFSLSTTNHGIAPPFLSPLVSFSWLKREDTMARRRLTSPTDFARPRTRFWPLRSKRARPTLTPSTSAIEREPGEIFERYTARRG